MNEIAQVIVRGNASPDCYEDFSAMLESSLAAVRKTNYVLCVDTDNMQLWAHTTNYASERGLQLLYGDRPLPVAHAVFFLAAETAKSFDTGNVQALPRPPTIFLF